ncbi:TPA: transglycosylase SLT domain-containing protein [Klebsiella oxytoca]|nr:transglycosylase SLT domain-containing protein [Klebsiella oxytoca]
MPRLPSANDLGRVSLRPATGVASPDLSAPFRAAQQLGNQVTQIAGEVADDQNRLDFGKAQTAWLQGQANTHAAFEKDNDYATMQDRYGQQMQKVTESSASWITSGRMRQEFDNWVNQQNIRGGEQIRSLAWSKEKDASIAGLNQSLETSRSTYLTSTDPATRQQILDATNNMIQGAASKGYIDQTQAQQLGQRWITDAATGSLKMMQPEQRLSALQNPTGIVSFLPPDQRQEMEKDALTETAANFALNNPQGWLNGEFNLGGGKALDMSAISLVESGGKHRNADGSLVTSPKGAQGEFQLMPDTGKELAAKRGMEYNPDDPVQHAQLARDYTGQLSKKYQSELLAGAAYNWGMGNVDKLIAKVGDPRKGEISDTEFISYLPAETKGWLAKYQKSKSGIDPMTIYKIDNLARAQMNEQSRYVRERVEPILNNTLTQLYNGDVPDVIPDRESIMQGWGQQGATMVKQLDVAIDNARTFQSIQYLPQSEQQAELAKIKPQVNDPDYTIKLDAYGKLNGLVNASNERIAAQRDASRFNEALAMGVKLDPSNKSMQKAADNTPMAINFRINDASTHDGVINQVAQTGIIPSQVTSQLNAVSRSSSPGVVSQGVELFNRLYGTDSASVTDMPKQTQGFYLTAKQLTDSGMATEEAIKQAQAVTYNQTDALKTQLSSVQSTKEYKKERSSAMDSARDNMAQWFRVDPSADDQTTEATRFRNDYQSLYDVNYRTSGGNSDAARKMTNQQIARTWSISEVNGKATFMKYAPEALYPFGPSGWQADQWKEEKERLTYGERTETISTDPTKLGITSGSASVITTNTPESRIGGELEITPDLLTARNGDYAIMVRMKDKSGNESVQPYYDKFGRQMRWKPSLEDWGPYQKMQQESGQQERDEIARGKNIRGFKEKHRALDKQYQRSHEERMDRFKNYFSWGTE